jgi:hypothetical protein
MGFLIKKERCRDLISVESPGLFMTTGHIPSENIL